MVSALCENLAKAWPQRLRGASVEVSATRWVASGTLPATSRGMDIDVTFPGGKRVDAHVEGFVVHTDQSIGHGGLGSAPEPFVLFLASLATCAGLYVLGFCQARGIPTDELRLVERSENDASGRLARVTLEVHVPPTFPDHYRDAVARAAAACKVKKTLSDPPRFDVTTIVDDSAASAA